MPKKSAEQIKKELASEYYGAEASQYEEKRVSDKRHAAVVDIQYTITEKFLNEPYKKILDVACGTGRFFRVYKGEIYGIDVSADMLKEAAKKKKAKILKQADASKIPFKNNFFDIAITSQFIKHTPEYKQVIAEMARVVRPGGAIIIDFPNHYSITNFFTKLRVFFGKLRHYNFFSLKDIRGIAKENALEIEQIEPTVVVSPLFFPKSMLHSVMALNKSLTKWFPKLTYVYYVKFRKK